MIIEVEDRFCKAAELFLGVLAKLEEAAERDDTVHEVEERTWVGLLEMGRRMIAGYIEKQSRNVARPEVIEHEGKKLRRLPQTRSRRYVSVFGPTPFDRDVYAVRGKRNVKRLSHSTPSWACLRATRRICFRSGAA